MSLVSHILPSLSDHFVQLSKVARSLILVWKRKADLHGLSRRHGSPRGGREPNERGLKERRITKWKGGGRDALYIHTHKNYQTIQVRENKRTWGAKLYFPASSRARCISSRAISSSSFLCSSFALSRAIEASILTRAKGSTGKKEFREGGERKMQRAILLFYPHFGPACPSFGIPKVLPPPVPW